MSRRSTPRKKTDDWKFPIRLRIVVPDNGYGWLINDIHDWSERTFGRGNYAIHGDNIPGCEASAYYFRTPDQVKQFRAEYPSLQIADLVQDPLGSSADDDWGDADVCGRFTKSMSWEELFELYSEFLDPAFASNAPPRYNITPMQEIDFVYKRDGKYHHENGQWSLVPHWVKEPPKPGEKKYAMHNARSETVATSPGFRDAFKYGRCIIFADGYYEWTKNPDDGEKDPHYIHMPNRKPFAFAGLWSYNKHQDITSCTIVTAPAEGRIKKIHPRMPIVLRDELLDKWMDLETSVDEALILLSHNRAKELTSYLVSRDVNGSETEGPALVKPIWPEGEEPFKEE